MVRRAGTFGCLTSAKLQVRNPSLKRVRRGSRQVKHNDVICSRVAGTDLEGQGNIVSGSAA